MAKRWDYYSKENRDMLYYAYLTPGQKRFEKFLNVFYIALMIVTFLAAVAITVVSRSHTDMTVFGMCICEICIPILRSGTVPLFDIRFVDHKKYPEVKFRSNLVLITVGMCFLLFIGYTMMYVGVQDFIYDLMREAAKKG